MNLNRRIDHDARYHQTIVSNLFTLILLLSAAVGGVALARRLKLPPVLSYLLIGIAIGPHGLAMLHESEEVHALAEFGIVFLMFSVGLEFSLQHLKTMRSLVFGFGTTQLILTALGAGITTWIFYGQGWRSDIRRSQRDPLDDPVPGRRPRAEDRLEGCLLDVHGRER